MKEYTLPKNGSLARMSILDGTDLPEVLALQEATRDALPADKKMYILPQGTSYFQNLLTRQTGLMVGIHAEGKLIAQMVLMGPMNLSEAIARHVITGNDVVFHHAALTDSVIIFKSMASHPDWRGNDLANALMSFALELPLPRSWCMSSRKFRSATSAVGTFSRVRVSASSPQPLTPKTANRASSFKNPPSGSISTRRSSPTKPTPWKISQRSSI